MEYPLIALVILGVQVAAFIFWNLRLNFFLFAKYFLVPMSLPSSNLISHHQVFPI